MTKKQRIRLAEEAYFRKILGFEYEETKTTEEFNENDTLTKRKVETSKRLILPDEKALYEYLCKNAPDKWGTAAKAEENTGTGVVILPKEADDE